MVVVLVIIFLLFIRLLNDSIYPAVISLSESKAKNIATDALLDSILEALSKDEDYSKILQSETNENRVYMLKTDTAAMNRLAATCTNAAQEKLSDLGEQGVDIALGTLSGISFFSGIGPDITVKFSPAGNVTSRFVSSLDASGINQTLYRVSIVLDADIHIILPSVSHSFTVSAQAAIAESVIVGDVPQAYTNVANEEDLLNLIPSAGD